MFKLPVCPHCKTVYHYQETRHSIRKKNCICYHCKQNFRASIFPGIWIIGAIMVALSILVNLFLLSRMTYLNLIWLFVSTVVFLGLLYILIPFFVTFKKDKTETNKTNKKRK